MYKIYEDDLELTAVPSLDSDGRVELYWDHPSYPKQWCARHAPYPYDSEEWTELNPFSENTHLDTWGPYVILLLHFGLYRFFDNNKDAPSEEILKLSPEELKALRKLPPEILRQGLEACYEYQRQLTLTVTEHNEAKLILVGQGGVGKTCLAKRLIHDKFEEQKSTEGIDVLSWDILAPTKEQQEIRLNVWDFGGQEIYHATHQFFLTKRSIYLLVWNARKSKDYEHIYFWLYTIETFGEDSPIILVMTKCNDRDDDLNMKDLREKFPQIVGLYKVDNEDGKGILVLKNIIREITWKLPHMRTQWSDSWFNVRKRLENDGRNWIEQNEFQRICTEEDLDTNQANILGEYLHDLGAIIHFHDNLRLRNLVILKPDWITKAVYKVLDTQSVSQREGILRHSELEQIWDTGIYSPALFINLLELMNEFELVYELPDKKSHLVAELLPGTEPDFFWNNEDNLCFYYNYDFLPAGIITRLIVLIHPHLELKTRDKHLCWREGCVLQSENTRALVRLKKIEKLIEIRVWGRKKRELLAIIRNHINYINRSIKKVEIIQQVPCNCSVDCRQRFEYELLLRAESKKQRTIQCHHTLKYISLSQLLDGYEREEDRGEYDYRKGFGQISTIQVRDKGTLNFSYQGEVKNMTKQEKVIKIGKEAKISAPVVIADTIENSFNTLMDSKLDDNLEQLLDQLLKEINEVNKKVPQDKAEEAEAMARDAEALVKEATSSKPRKRWYEVSLDGLKQAAINIGEIADPIMAIVKKLTPLLLT